MEGDVRQLLELPPERELMSQQKMPGDIETQRQLRPQTWDEFIGHDRQKLLLMGSAKRRGLLTAALERQESADHILLHGPPGLGKTALSDLIQETLGHGRQMASSMTGAQVSSTLIGLRYKDVLFTDEIHSLKPAAMESLQIAMEGGLLGLGRRVLPFTLIGATTKYGKLPGTLRDRFGLTLHLEYYGLDEIGKILANSAAKLNMTLRKASAGEVALRSRGVPRIANRLLKRLRDVTDEPTPARAKRTLAELGVDSWGMDDGDRGILMLLFTRFDGGPVGVRTLAAASGLEERTLIEAFEPYFLRVGVLDIVPRGRQLSEKGFTYCQQVDKLFRPN